MGVVSGGRSLEFNLTPGSVSELLTTEDALLIRIQTGDLKSDRTTQKEGFDEVEA